MRNIVDLSSLTDKELAERLASLKSELFNLRFTHRAGSLENNMSLQACKRNIARVKTVMRQRELGLVTGPVKVDDKKSSKTEKKSSSKAVKEEKPKAEKKSAEESKNKKTTKASAKVDAEVKG